MLFDVSGAMDEVQVVDVEALEEQHPKDVDKFEEREWHDAEIEMENDDEM